MKSLALTIGTMAALSVLTAACSGTHLGEVSSSSSNAVMNTPLVVANAVMKDQGMTYALPSSGGLVADLYIQPRAQMIAPDTQIVGCYQNGSGALGLPAYLSQPTWINNQVLFTDLNVPARSFLSGFPLSAGGTVPVNSYFALDMKGNFHLADGEPEGFYQFAAIADDSAVVRTSSEGTFDQLLVDDQKPAGPNGGCLEQTQSPHLSCSSVWSDQSTSKMRVVYLRPGQSIPMQVQYWQGPGGGIAMMVLYRHVADPTQSSQLAEASCGKELNFSATGAGLTDLLTRWKTVSFNNLKSL